MEIGSIVHNWGYILREGHNFFANCCNHLFIALSPSIAVIIFLSLMPGYTLKQRLRVTQVACLSAWAAMVMIAAMGPYGFNLLGGATPLLFRGACTFFLCLIGIRVLFTSHVDIALQSEEENSEVSGYRLGLAVVPLGVPLIASGNVLGTIAKHVAECDGVGRGLWIFAITVVMVLIYVLLYIASQVAYRLKESIRPGCYQLSGLVLICFGVYTLFHNPL